MSVMQIFLNGNPEIEYDRAKSLTERQLEYLDKMDKEMAAGFQLGGERIDNPDLLQQAQFVASYLAQALFSNNDQMIVASCAWLALRLPDMKQVKLVQEDDQVSIDLVFNENRQNQVHVDLKMPGKDKSLH